MALTIFTVSTPLAIICLLLGASTGSCLKMNVFYERYAWQLADGQLKSDSVNISVNRDAISSQCQFPGTEIPRSVGFRAFELDKQKLESPWK
jgi:hypothetical protein